MALNSPPLGGSCSLSRLPSEVLEAIVDWCRWPSFVCACKYLSIEFRLRYATISYPKGSFVQPSHVILSRLADRRSTRYVTLVESETGEESSMTTQKIKQSSKKQKRLLEAAPYSGEVQPIPTFHCKRIEGLSITNSSGLCGIIAREWLRPHTWCLTAVKLDINCDNLLRVDPLGALIFMQDNPFELMEAIAESTRVHTLHLKITCWNDNYNTNWVESLGSAVFPALRELTELALLLSATPQIDTLREMFLVTPTTPTTPPQPPRVPNLTKLELSLTLTESSSLQVEFVDLLCHLSGCLPHLNTLTVLIPGSVLQEEYCQLLVRAVKNFPALHTLVLDFPDIAQMQGLCEVLALLDNRSPLPTRHTKQRLTSIEIRSCADIGYGRHQCLDRITLGTGCQSVKTLGLRIDTLSLVTSENTKLVNLTELSILGSLLLDPTTCAVQAPNLATLHIHSNRTRYVAVLGVSIEATSKAFPQVKHVHLHGVSFGVDNEEHPNSSLTISDYTQDKTERCFPKLRTLSWQCSTHYPRVSQMFAALGWLVCRAPKLREFNVVSPRVLRVPESSCSLVQAALCVSNSKLGISVGQLLKVPDGSVHN